MVNTASRVVLGRIGGDQLALKARLEKIERGGRHLGRGDELAVVGIDDGVDTHRGEGAVLVLVGGVDRIEALGLERKQRARPLPFAEILDGLEYREVGLHPPVRELLLDPAVEAVAQATGEGDGDAGEARFELADPTVVGPGRSGAVEHQCLFELGLGVELVEALGARLRRASGERGKEQHARELRPHPASSSSSIVRPNYNSPMRFGETP
jgi:hypothetical protein